MIQTFGNGQHPYLPDTSLQHVVPVGHLLFLSGHITASTGALVVPGILSTISIRVPFE